jgi:hypothetical protein
LCLWEKAYKSAACGRIPVEPFYRRALYAFATDRSTVRVRLPSSCSWSSVEKCPGSPADPAVGVGIRVLAMSWQCVSTLAALAARHYNPTLCGVSTVRRKQNDIGYVDRSRGALPEGLHPRVESGGIVSESFVAIKQWEPL